VFAIFKADAPLPDELEKEFVYDAGRLQKMLGPLTAKQSARYPAQFRIDDIKQAVQRLRLASRPFAKEDSNLTVLVPVVCQTMPSCRPSGPSTTENSIALSPSTLLRK
jgi:hypothetical protein